MDDTNKNSSTSLTDEDINAIRTLHDQLHALLEFISLDECHPFTEMNGEQQRHLLRLACSASQLIKDCFD